MGGMPRRLLKFLSRRVMVKVSLLQNHFGSSKKSRLEWRSRNELGGNSNAPSKIEGLGQNDETRS